MERDERAEEAGRHAQVRWDPPSLPPYSSLSPEPARCDLCSNLERRADYILTRHRLQALIREHHDDIARAIVLEQGKTFADAKGDVLRGLQVVDAACAIPTLLMGDKLEVSKDMDTETRRVPLGVGAAICPCVFFASPLSPWLPTSSPPRFTARRRSRSSPRA